MSCQTQPKTNQNSFTRPLTVLLCLVGSIVFVGFPNTTGHSQDPDPSKQQRPRQVSPPSAEPIQTLDEILRIDTDLVSVDVNVTDAAGRTVRNLQQKDFTLYEDDNEQPLAFFHLENRSGLSRPVAIVFALDISGSMTPDELERLRGAMHVFSEKLSTHPSSFAVMSFGMRVKTLQNFTSEAEKLDRAFDKLAREPNGLSTHTYDAVDDAIRLLVRHAPRTRDKRLMKRAVVVITDGFPVGDTVAPETVIERANTADVSVYVVTLPSYSRLLVSADRAPLPTPLDISGLVQLTGGKNVYARDKDYEPLFRALAEEVTSSYVLAFYPPLEKRRDGKFHSIRVEGPKGLQLRQSRPGYQAGKQ
ncbi:MAG TPA: VWA domain-containing protein [Pyrinomonadaceae bacterium]|nr:VWA domain-containing protein [Pyrinomonadaceae bacterium]